MKTSDFVASLLKKAEIQFDGEVNGELPDEIATQLDNSLLTIKAATNNHPAVKKKYTAEVLNGIDAQIERMMDEYQFDDDAKSELKTEQSTSKRIDAFVKRIKALSAKKDDTVDTGKASKLQQEISDLHEKLRAEQEKAKQEKQNFENQVKQIHIQSKVGALLSGYKTVFDDLETDAKNAAINSLLSKSLQDSDADWTFDEKGSLSLIKKDGTNLFGDNHTVITPQSFIDRTLSKILKVTNTQPGGGNVNPGAGGTPPVQTNVNGNLKNALGESLQNWETASKSAITG